MDKTIKRGEWKMGDWEPARLQDLGEVNRGRSRHRPRYAEHLYGGPYPFIQTGDIKASHGRITTYEQTYSEAGLAQSRLWPEGTLCITIAANIAETGILEFPACFPDSVVGFIADTSKCDVYFVEYLFRYLKSRIQFEASGSVQDNINLETLSRLNLLVPPLDEQRAIARILGALDDKIEANRRMNATLEATAQALFRSWFVDFDPVQAKAAGRTPEGMDAATTALFPDGFEASALGDVPRGWKICSLNEVANFIKGVSYKSSELRESNYALVTLKSIGRGGGYQESGLKSYSGQYKPEQVIAQGDLVVAHTDLTQAAEVLGAVARVPVHNRYGLLIASLDLTIVRPKSELSTTEYIYCLLQRAEFKDHARGYSNGTTVLHLSAKALPEFRFVCPTENLMQLFSGMIEPFYARHELNSAVSITLSELRDTLLPKLLSGELRVSEATTIAESERV